MVMFIDTVKNYLADVSSLSPSLEQKRLRRNACRKIVPVQIRAITTVVPTKG